MVVRRWLLVGMWQAQLRGDEIAQRKLRDMGRHGSYALDNIGESSRLRDV